MCHSGFLLLDELPRPPGYFDDFQFFAPTTSSTSSTTTRPPPPPRPPRKGHKVRDKSISVRTKFYLQPQDLIFVGASDVTRWNRVIAQVFPFASFLNAIDNLTSSDS